MLFSFYNVLNDLSICLISIKVTRKTSHLLLNKKILSVHNIKCFVLHNRYLEIPNLFSGLESQDKTVSISNNLKMILVAQNTTKYAVNILMKMTLYFEKKTDTEI